MISLEVENAAMLDPRGRKGLVSRVAKWLRVPRQTGDAVRIGAATLEVLYVGGNRLDIVTTEPMHVVTTPAKLVENFEEKAKRYGSLGFPVIAAAVKHYRADRRDRRRGRSARSAGIRQQRNGHGKDRWSDGTLSRWGVRAPARAERRDLDGALSFASPGNTHVVQSRGDSAGPAAVASRLSDAL